MCLTVKNNTKIETAKESIICYKVFKIEFYTDIYTGRVDSSEYDLVSYFQGMKYDPNVLYTLEKPLKIVNAWACPMVEEGFHSFVSQESAQMFLNVNDYVGMSIISKCKIPKGAKFVRGIFRAKGFNYESICSDQIIVLQESV